MLNILFVLLRFMTGLHRVSRDTIIWDFLGAIFFGLSQVGRSFQQAALCVLGNGVQVLCSRLQQVIRRKCKLPAKSY